MKTTILAAILCAAVAAHAETTIPVFNTVPFYDGYQVDDLSIVDIDETDAPYTRMFTYLTTVRLTDEQLDQIGEHLDMHIILGAACDNYDRIASVNLALVPKGQESYTITYDPAVDPERIELARFITPFMNKNKEPDEVPYDYWMDYASRFLRDTDLRARYDFWLELMIFGVPYAAQAQVAGCAGCNHVFDGTLWFTSEGATDPVNTSVLVPITIRTADYRADRGVNSYHEGNCDELGVCGKTWTFTVPEDVADAQIVLISSNHGAGTNGEEYVRRMHYIYVDGELVLTYKPGGVTCEPYRQYNTQSNGIYGTRRSEASWIATSNWCPGAAIDTRIISLGAFPAGEHSLYFYVPDAEFYGTSDDAERGYFPVSAYFLGDTQSTLPNASLPALTTLDGACSPVVTVNGDTIDVTCTADAVLIELYDTQGHTLAAALPTAGRATLAAAHASLSSPSTPGVHLVVITTPTLTYTHKLILP